MDNKLVGIDLSSSPDSSKVDVYYHVPGSDTLHYCGSLPPTPKTMDDLRQSGVLCKQYCPTYRPGNMVCVGWKCRKAYEAYCNDDEEPQEEREDVQP